MATSKATSGLPEKHSVGAIDSGSDAIEQTKVKCAEHPSDDIALYCKDHRALCCQFCFHRDCPGIKFITEIVHDKPLKIQLQDAQLDLNMVKTDVEHARETRKQNRTALGETSKNVVSIIERMQNKLDVLKEKAIADMKVMQDDCDTAAAADIRKCDSVVDEMTKQLRELDTVNPEDENRMFIDIQRALQKIRYGDDLIEKLSEATENGNYKFTKNAGAEIFLEMETLGDFARTFCDSEVIANDISRRKIRPDVDRIYTVRGTQNYVARLNGDKYMCDIRGTCQLPNGQLLLADYNNKNVKLVNPATYDVIAKCILSKSPLSICTIDDNIAAICLDRLFGNTMALVSVQDNGIFSQEVNAELARMKAVTHFDNELYTFSKTATCSLFVIKTNGNLARKVDFREAITWPKKIAISPDGSRLYITTERGLVTMTRDGKLLAILNNDRIREASGVCVDDAGNVFVTGKQSNNVCQVSRAGDTLLNELASAADGLDCPRSVCFDRVNSAIVVASSSKKGCDTFHVFNVK